MHQIDYIPTLAYNILYTTNSITNKIRFEYKTMSCSIREHNAALKTYKEQLINMVPYRALAGFFNKSNETAGWGSVRRLTILPEGRDIKFGIEDD